MSELPDGWAWVSLQDLAAGEPRAMTDGPFGSNLKSSHYVDSGPRVIRLQNIGFGEFIDERAHITEAHFEKLRAYEVRAGDMVVASLGQDLPRACLIPPSVGPAIVKADCIRVRLGAEVDPKFVNYALQRPALRRAVADQVHGVGRPRIGMANIKALTIPLAPRAEQQRIVASIEEHLSRLEATERSLEAARRRTVLLKERLIDAAFRRFSERVPVGSLAEVSGGIQKQPKRKPRANTAPFLRVANVFRGRLDLDEVHEIELFDGELARFQLQPGDLLVVEGNGSPGQIGRSALWGGQIPGCVHQNHLIRVRPGPRLNSHFLDLYWNAPSTSRQLSAVASSTSGLYTLSTAKVKRVEVPLASLAEQAQVVEELSGQLDAVHRLSDAIHLAKVRHRAARRSILAAAFSGQLVPQDPGEEPVAALLERIQAERVATIRPERNSQRKAS
jgi:type I restriction enzyme S subunit